MYAASVVVPVGISAPRRTKLCSQCQFFSLWETLSVQSDNHPNNTQRAPWGKVQRGAETKPKNKGWSAQLLLFYLYSTSKPPYATNEE